ncbi:MAG TPA: class I SAM-dependent methyltransferase [Candidatus Methylomirabilis sp.]|nr:class I SAM-dependent methyltransferase [Candidatus Methylomirabilis sp.]
MGQTRERLLAWPSECYPPAILAEYPFLERAPGPGALRRVLPRYQRTGLRVLDIGCGAGIGACHLAASGAQGVRYTGVDPDVGACQRARNILAALPQERISGTIFERSVHEHLDTDPSPVDLILWSFAFHDCANVAEEQATAILCASVAAVLLPGGHLVLVDGCFAAGVPADEIERTYAHMERIVGHSDRGRYFPLNKMTGLFTEAGLTLIERHEVPLVALARFLALPHARAALLVFAKPVVSAAPSGKPQT